MGEYRVEELAAEVGVTVELLRSYQSKGLLPAPRHEGRVAIYGDGHLARLREILDLKHQGYSLRMIPHLVGAGGAADAAGSALGEAADAADVEPLTLRQVAERARVPPSMLRSLQASGVLVPRVVDGDDERRYSTGDVRAVRMLLALISSGLPIEELMAAAHPLIEACEQGAHDARDLFLRYGRGEAGHPDELVAALALMLQATTTLISYNFQRRIVNAVTLALQQTGATDELDALRLEVLPA